MQMVGIRMRLTLDHFSHDHTGQATRNLFLLLHGVYFDAYVRHRVSDLRRSQVKFEIIFQPIVRELHNYLFINIFL